MPSSACKKKLSNTQLTVDATKTLTLNGTIVTGGTVIFFFNDTATTEIYTLSLHDALPIFTVDTTKTLTLDNTTVTGTTIADNGTVKVDATKTLNLSGVALGGAHV